MRLAFLTHEPFYPPSGGGSAEAIYLVQELTQRQHDVHLFCPAFPNHHDVARQFNCTIHPFTLWPMGRYTSLRTPKYLLYPRFLKKLVTQTARQTRFDAILSQHAISAVAAGQLGQQLQIPVAMNFLDHLTGFMETWPRWKTPRPLLNRLKAFELSLPSRYHAKAVLTVSDPLADLFAQTGFPRHLIHPIYYGFDAAAFQPPPPNSTPQDPPVVVMHGSFDQHHLGPIALQALQTVHAQMPNVRFRFVGRETPSLSAFCKKANALMPRLTLERTGFIPYTQTAAQLHQASVGIVPYEESSGVHCAFVAKIVEYLATGLPVVSTTLQSASRYFHDEPAARFAGFNGKPFGQAILDWLNQPVAKRQSLGRKASQRVTQHLNWSTICQNAADFMEHAASQ